jgi:hypothetical protein
VWRLTMFLMCLIAALSGTPLRQAEAASDFARSLSELDEGHSIEMIDGGVGDDSGATILKVGGDSRALRAMIPMAMLDGLLVPPPAALSLSGSGHRHPAERVETLPACSSRRHAWLQCFLF